MCGPFVLGQVGEKLRRIPVERLCERQRVATGLLPFYHFGRIATYTALGAIAAWGGASLSRLPWFGPLSGLLLLAAAAAFLTIAVARLAPRLAPALTADFGAAGGLGRRLAGFSRRFDPTRWYGGLGLGLVLGLLPCGFLYAALAVAAATARPLQGALLLVAFGTGTVPVLASIGIAGLTVRRAANRLAPFILAFNALMLSAAGWHVLFRR
jgi:sulfite exporter TauE/SafE